MPLNSLSRDIFRFLERAEGSLLLKGEPGTGKTLLALRIAEEFENSFYVSTRVSAKDLVDMYPFLKRSFSERDVIDVYEKPMIIDARASALAREIDDASSMILWMKYEDKPSFLKELAFLVREKESPLVIVDSLEAIEEYVEREVLRDLLEMSSELDLRLILVAEKSEMSRADYFVDGVIELVREIIDDAVLRRMRILKLRGCSIDQPEYLFTLKDGIFRVFEPFSYEPPEKPRLFQPLDDPDENHFSSGSRSLDEIFQRGFPKGSSILFEVGEGVTREMYHRFDGMITMNFLRNGRKVYVIPTLGTDKERSLKEIQPFLGKDELKNLSFIECEWGKERLRGEEAIEEAEKVYEIKSELRGKELEELTVVGMDSLYSRYGEATPIAVEEGERYIRDTKGLALFIVKPGFPFLEEISNLCDIHIKMENICGVPVVRGKKPKTQYYAMMVDLSEGFPRVEFERIE